MIAAVIFITIATTVISVASFLLNKIKELAIGFPIVVIAAALMLAMNPFTPTDIMQIDFQTYPCTEDSCPLILDYARIEIYDINHQIVGYYAGPVSESIMVPMKRIPEEMTVTVIFVEDYLDLSDWPLQKEGDTATIKMQKGIDNPTFYLTILARNYGNPLALTGDIIELATNLDPEKDIWAFAVALVYFLILGLVYIIVGTVAITLYRIAKGTYKFGGKIKKKITNTKMPKIRKERTQETQERKDDSLW